MRDFPFNLGNEGISWVNADADGVIEGVKEMNNLYHTFDRKKLHGITNKFHELKFKSEVKRRLEIYSEVPAPTNPSECC